MVPNRVFVALFGIGGLALATYHLTENPIQWVGVIAPALVGLFLLNLAAGIGRRRHGHGFGCGPRNRSQASDTPAAQG